MGKSSKDKRDAYYRLAKEQSWRARSAFKLIQLDEQFDLFSGCTRVVDLCAAPGSWSQVLSRVLVKGEKFGRQAWEEKRARENAIVQGVSSLDLKEESTLDVSHGSQGESSVKKSQIKIVAIDLQPMSPLEGITMLQGDITHPSTIPRILEALDPLPAEDKSTDGDGPIASQDSRPRDQNPVDLIVSDGAPDVTGLHDLDIHIQYTLLTSALSLALRILRPGTGKFVAKIFRGKDCDMLIYSQLQIFFAKVSIAKPRASRASSLEAFVVCEEFLGIPSGFVLGNLGGSALNSNGGIILERGPSTAISENTSFQDTQREKESRWIPPFVACGDLSAWDDADATTHLPKDRVSLDPVQPPTAPPYKEALEMRRQRGGFYGRTTKDQARQSPRPPDIGPSSHAEA